MASRNWIKEVGSLPPDQQALACPIVGINHWRFDQIQSPFSTWQPARENQLGYTDPAGRGESFMGRIETLLHKELFSFLFSPTAFFSLLFLGRAIFFTTLETIWPARILSYRSVIWNDLVACGTYVFVVFPAASYLSRFVPGYYPFPPGGSNLPLALRVALYFILDDFGHYWVHRLHHARYFWGMHKWHHSPTYMYWLGGVRGTLPQQVMVNVSYVLAYPFLDISPWWMAMAIAVSSAIQNDWMHRS